MAGFSDRFESDLLRLILAAKGIAEIADNTATSAATAIWVSLHTADPGDSSGEQGELETTQAQYTRIGVARTTAGWTISTTGGAASPTANIDFPQGTDTSTGTYTHAGLGMASAATSGVLFASGALSPNINYSQNVTPRITTGSSFTLD